MLKALQRADDESLAQSGKQILFLNSLAAALALLGLQYSHALLIAGIGTLGMTSFFAGMFMGPIVRKRTQISDVFARHFESVAQKNPVLRLFSTLAATLVGQSVAVVLTGLLFYLSGWSGANEMTMVGGITLVPALGLLFYVVESKLWDGPLVALAYRMFLPPIATGLVIAVTTFTA